jgi:tetratricopeptide (TPR) repeat protein
MRPSISLVVIAKNEINNINRWYDSVSGLFDEYIFCDTGSTDGTIEKARELGLKVIHFEWCDDFSAARNFATSHATSDYVFWTDLDDSISDKVAFTHWRDHSMCLAEYWLAPYHYALTPEGKPACSFMRERAWKRSLGLQWQYFIHEGVNPHGPRWIATPNVINTWAVLHHRTMEDLAKDKGRNLGIFKKHLASGVKLDARMQYYYGKELFEAGQHADGAVALATALANEKLELHDRILCMQYAAYAYQKCNQFDKALAFARLGIELAPQRAEFWVIAADCLVKEGKYQDALPFYAAAMKCTDQNQNSRQVGLIFTTADAYGPYPANMLARCLCHLGRFDEAVNEITFALTKWDNPESRLILDEIKRIKTAVIEFKDAKSCDDIVFT